MIIGDSLCQDVRHAALRCAVALLENANRQAQDTILHDLVRSRKEDLFIDALATLNDDRGFLTAGGVFSDDFIDNWIDIKYEEVQQLRQRPHPHEFTMYYDA